MAETKIWLNPLVITTTSSFVEISFTLGEFTLASGVRVSSYMPQGQEPWRRDDWQDWPEELAGTGEPGSNAPVCKFPPPDIQDVIFSRDGLRIQRAYHEGPSRSTTPINAMASIAEDCQLLEGTIETPNGETHIQYGDSQVVIKDAGAHKIEMRRDL